jgi:hypothetical protein
MKDGRKKRKSETVDQEMKEEKEGISAREGRNAGRKDRTSFRKEITTGRKKLQEEMKAGTLGKMEGRREYILHL